MKKYFAYAKCGFIDSLAYRSSFIVSIIAQITNLIILYFVWKSIFMYHNTISGYTWLTMKQYILIAFVCNSAFSYTFESQLSKRIIQGDIILDFVKPIRYKMMLFSRLLGSSTLEYLITCSIAVIIMIITVHGYSIHGLRLLLFLISVAHSLIIKFSIQFLFSILCFYTDNYYGVTKGREVLTNFFSGALIPLMLFPKEVCKIIESLPFSGIVYIPTNIFIGIYSINDSLSFIFIQFFWAIILWITCDFAWNIASKKCAFYGG